METPITNSEACFVPSPNFHGLQRFLAGIQQLEVHRGQLEVLLNK